MSYYRGIPTDDSSKPIRTDPLTFLFTDVEGSVRLWAADIDGTARSFFYHDEIIKGTIAKHGGTVFGTAGDSFRGVFSNPSDAVKAATECQDRLRSADWSSGPALRVRIGLHHGPATERAGDYFGPVPNTSARVEALGHGGQILITDAVADELALADDGCVGSESGHPLQWLGEYRLRDVPEPVSIYQVGELRFPALRHIDPALSSLPNLGSRLIGRLKEVSGVRGALSHHSVVTLSGYGGCGKTKLALEVAHQELPNRPDGCYFVDLSAVVDENEFPAAVATAIRLTLTGTDPTEQILDYLAGRDALLVLDNCEHLVETCADFAELLMKRCEATLLVTSRQRLDIADEEVVVVAPLAHNSPTSPAVLLFLERAGAVQADPGSSEPDLEAIQEICTRLDGIPLAIELAAARASVLTPAELLERMVDRFRLLSGGRQRAKRRTLEATLDWSYGLLEDEEKQLFRQVGVFSGTFDLPAASAVSNLDDYQTMDLLQSLVIKSLVSTTTIDGLTRFNLLETVRAYALDRLDDSGNLQAARDLHLRYFAELVSTESWTASCDIIRGSELRVEWSNLNAALEWAAACGYWAQAAEMAFGCQGLWEHQIPAIEGRRWLQQILPELSPDTGERAHQLSMNLALLAMQLDDFETMHEYLTPLDETTSPVTAAQALGYRAFTRIRHDSGEAIILAERAESLVETHQLGPEAATPSMWSRGTLALYDARFEDALPLLEEAYRSARSEDSFTTHGVIAGLACASNLVLLNRPKEAIAVLDDGTWESVWDASDIVRALALLGLGEGSDAAELIISFGKRAVLGRLSRMPNDALVGLAALAINRNERERAWELLLQAMTPRTPASIALAEGLADQIGRGAELRGLHRNRLVSLATLDATDALTQELDRLTSDSDAASGGNAASGGEHKKGTP